MGDSFRGCICAILLDIIPKRKNIRIADIIPNRSNICSTADIPELCAIKEVGKDGV